MKKINQTKHTIGSLLVQYSLIFVIALVFFMPGTMVNACGKPGEPKCPTADIDNTQQNSANIDNTQTKKNGDGIKIETGIKNPIAGVEDIPSFIETILNFVLTVGIPIVALAIIYSGFLFVTAAGNSEKLTKAKKALLYTLVGAALLLGSYVIANAIKGTVDEIRSTTKRIKDEKYI